MYSSYKIILVYSFALFAMFFGSGNLVFPIKIGQITGQYWYYGFIGLFFTGIILPFLGLFVVKLHNGNYYSFFAEGGKFAKIILPFLTLSLLGSFGVVPRCITVAHGSIYYYLPKLNLTYFSAIFCISMFFFCLKEKRMVHLIGKWMSPMLLLSLVWLIISGIYKSDQNFIANDYTPVQAIYNGFITGYQTMDLFAAFFFSALTFKQLQAILPANATSKEVIAFATKPSLIGAGLLSTIYLGFVYLGSHFQTILCNIPPELMLSAIANHVIGSNATIIIGIAVIFSCLTTAIALNNIYAKYLSSALGLSENNYPKILFLTTIISFFVSLFDFKNISKFLGLMLEITYPSVIILTIISIITHKFCNLKIFLFYGIIIVNIVQHLYF